jgi:hypothetical protein
MWNEFRFGRCSFGNHVLQQSHHSSLSVSIDLANCSKMFFKSLKVQSQKEQINTKVEAVFIQIDLPRKIFHTN